MLFTDIDGLYTANPVLKKDAKKIDVVEKITEEIEIMAGSAISKVGTGGMRTKIEAAKIATNAGISMVVASRNEVGMLHEIVAGKKIGTLFKATHRPLHARKSWILYGSEAEGVVVVDDGAKRALQEKGRSLRRAGSSMCREILIVARSLPLQICREIALPKGSRIIPPCSWSGSRV